MDRETNNGNIICRTCLKVQENLFNIFEHFRNKLISNMLIECFTITVQKDERLPMNICSNCLEKLNSACAFKAMVIESDMKLHDFYCKNILSDGSLYDAVKEESVYILGSNNNNTCVNFRSAMDTKSNLTLNQGESQSGSLQDNSEIIDVVSVIEECADIKERHVEDTVDVNNATENLINEDSNILLSNDSHFLSSHDVKEESVDILGNNNNNTCVNFRNAIDTKSNLILNQDEPKGVSLLENSEVIGVIQEYAGMKEMHVEDASDAENVTENLINEDVQGPLVDNMKKMVEIKAEGSDKKNLLMQSLGIDEYEHLRSTLSTEQKKTTSVLCKLCNKSFKFYYYFQVHIPQHTGQVAHKCEKCGKGFPSEFFLKKHKLKYKEDRPYTCEVCGKTFKLSSSLRRHTRVHSDEYQYKCNICPKMYKHRNSLKDHLQKHNGGKSYVCEICGKSFTYSSSMSKHKLWHNTENNVFTCSICEKFFNTKVALNEHLKRHTKTYACTYCDKKFSTLIILKHHISIHTGAKPYACKVCGKTFRQSTCIRRHMRIHTGETPYECEKCPAKFKHKYRLIKHIKVHE